MNQSVANLLRSVGISRNYRGYQYLCDAVALATEDENCLRDVVRSVYGVIAEKYGTSWSSVERDIRTCVRRAWLVNPQKVQLMAGFHLEAAPTASQFIEYAFSFSQLNQ